MTFSDSGRSDQNGVVVFADKVASGEIVNLCSLHGRVEFKVEIIDRLLIAKGSRLRATSNLSVTTDDQFVGEDQLEEFGMIQFRTLCFRSRTSRDCERPLSLSCFN